MGEDRQQEARIHAGVDRGSAVPAGSGDSSFEHRASAGITRRALTAGILAAGGAALLSACGLGDLPHVGSAPASDPATSGATSTTLRYSIDAPAAIDPAGVADAAGTQVAFQLFDPLTAYDFELGKLTSRAAERYEVDESCTLFTFSLRQATFHDGSPVTSRDFKRAWERIVNPKSAAAQLLGPSPAAYLLSLVKGYDDLLAGASSELAGVSCPNDATLQVMLSQPYADFAYLLAHPALGPVPAAAEQDARAYAAAPVGNGAFKMDGSFTEGGDIDLVRNDAYWGGAPNVERVRFVARENVSSAYKEFQADNLDVAAVPTSQADGARRETGEAKDGFTLTPDTRLLMGAELYTYFIVLNTSESPLDDVDVRRALSLAIDREGMCQALFKGMRLPADGIVPPGTAGYEQGSWRYATYDLDAAKALLDIGHPAKQGGSRDLTVTLSYNDQGPHKKIMERLEADIEKLGITVELETASWTELEDRLAAGDFDAARSGWTPDAPTLDSVLYPLFFTGSAHNASGFSDSDVDRDITQARATRDGVDRLARLKAVNRSVGDEVPVIPLMFGTLGLEGSDRLQSLYVDPQGRAHLAEAELQGQEK